MPTVAEKETVKKVVFKLGPAGAAIDKLSAIREKKRKLEAEIKDIEGEYAELEEALMAKMASEGIDKATGTSASVSISTNVVGNPIDWKLIENYIAKNKFFHLFQRRLSDPGLREIWDQGKKVPGVEPFVKRRLNLRNL